MTIYTDGVHLVSDHSVNDLHHFAREIGLEREWFQDKPGRPHYDMTTARKARLAELHGARRVRPRDIIKALRRWERWG